MSEFRRFFQSKMPLIWAAVLFLNAALLIGAHGTEREAAHIAETVLFNAGSAEGETASDRVLAARVDYLAEYRKTHEKIAQAVKDGLSAAYDRAVYVDGYRRIVENRIEESERALRSGFYRTGSAEWTSLQAGLREQRKYLGYEPALARVEWLDVLLSHLWTPVLLLGILLLTVLIFFNASQRGLRPVLFVTKNGRHGLFFRRLALLSDPKLLILDEPTAGLDPAERASFRDYLKGLAEEKIILFLTHVVSDVEHTADTILIVRQGKLVRAGAPAELTAAAQEEQAAVKTLEDAFLWYIRK